MGNVVLMPQLYGYNIKRQKVSERKPRKQQDQPIEVRHITYRSTYDDYTESSLFSHRNDSDLQQLNKRTSSKEQNALFKTQSSLIGENVQKQLNLEIYTAQKKKDNTVESDHQADHHQQEENINNKSIINILDQFEDTESERLAIQTKCSLLLDLGQKAWKNGWFKQSIKYLEDVLRESSANYPKEVNQRAKLYSILGNDYIRIQNFKKAIQNYHQSLRLLMENPEQNVAQCGDVHMTLGYIYQRMKHFEQALQHFGKAYQLKKLKYPTDNKDLIIPLNNIALTESFRGNHVKALQKYGEALAINKEIYGSCHIEVARNFYKISLSLFVLAQYSMWLQYHYQSLRMLKDLNLHKAPEYTIWLDEFRNKLRQLLHFQHISGEIVSRSISLVTLLLDEDEQIKFLSDIKEDIEKSIIKQPQN